MRNIFKSIFTRYKERPPRYRLYDTWEPDFLSELNVAVSSFHADDAFHRVFGDSDTIPEAEIRWHFIGFILRDRSNPIRHVVTVRRNKELKAMVTGTVVCGESNFDQLTKALDDGRVPTKPVRSMGERYSEQRHSDFAAVYDAVENKKLEQRIQKYFKLISKDMEVYKSMPIRFSIGMIAVGPDEQGQGHARAMVDRLIDKYKDATLVENIDVSTYDKSKVDLYTHLGFEVTDVFHFESETAWRLTLPLR